jgi:hypothetical protein
MGKKSMAFFIVGKGTLKYTSSVIANAVKQSEHNDYNRLPRRYTPRNDLSTGFLKSLRVNEHA